MPVIAGISKIYRGEFMLLKHQYQFSKRMEMHEVTEIIKKDVQQSGIQEGIAVVYTPHTTAGITINENADPEVVRDILAGFERTFPTYHEDYRHFEENSHAHMKSTVFNASQTLIIHQGKIILGTWQGIYLCEFDGPRNRTFYVKIIAG